MIILHFLPLNKLRFKSAANSLLEFKSFRSVISIIVCIISDSLPRGVGLACFETMTD